MERVTRWRCSRRHAIRGEAGPQAGLSASAGAEAAREILRGRRGLVARPTGAEVPALKQGGSLRIGDRHRDPGSVERDGRPAFVPRTTGRREGMTRTAGASNPQVRNRICASSLVAKSTPRTLSRWRHGFEPRWDYQGKRIVGVLVSTLVKQTRAFGPHRRPGQAR